jgi:serine O-acetyltransferase
MSCFCPFEGEITEEVKVKTWMSICEEAKFIKQNDSFLADIIDQNILQHNSFGRSIAYMLSRAFESQIKAEKWFELFSEVYDTDYPYQAEGQQEQCCISRMGMFDLASIIARDPACDGMVNPMLNFKGFKSLQAHRVAHVLWNQGRKDLARHIQARCGEVFAVDIHPAAKIGRGLMIDHATGLVVGETCVIGKNCAFLHGVTLGATGKEKQDRHPKIGDYVLIGCNASVLGNISVGNCCKIGSGSIVLKPLPAFVTAVGMPAKVIGKSVHPEDAAKDMDTALLDVVNWKGESYHDRCSIWTDAAEEKKHSSFAKEIGVEYDHSGYL